MEKLEVVGGKKLSGVLIISGSKNAVCVNSNGSGLVALLLIFKEYFGREEIMIQSNKHNINIIQNIIEDFSNASGCEDFVEETSLKEEIITKILIKETEF